MLNQIVLVGRLTETPEVEEGKAMITLAVPRSYKNENGEYDTDFIPVRLFKGIAESTAEYCKKSDLISIRGRVQMQENKLLVVAEKVTFLSSKRED